MINIAEHIGELDRDTQYKLKDWWVTATFLADRLEDAGKIELATETRGVQSLTAQKVVFVVDEKNTAAFVAPKNTKNIFYNTFTLGRGADHEHIVEHEEGHLEQDEATGDPFNIPGIRDLSHDAKIALESKTGVPLGDNIYLVEGFNENRTINQKGVDEDCWYLQGNVPDARKLSDFIHLQTGVSPAGCFLRMTKTSMAAMGNAIVEAGNILLLEQTAAQKVEAIWPNQKRIIRRIAQQTSEMWVSIRNESHAWKIIKNVWDPDNLSED